MNWLSVLGPYALLIKVVAFGVLLGTLFMSGCHYGAKEEKVKWDKLEGARAAAAQKQNTAAEAITHNVEVKYVDVIRTVQVKGDTIIKEVPKYVTSKSDANCTIPAGFVRVFNGTTSQSEVSNTPSGADDAAAGVVLSTVAEAVARNQERFEENAVKLEALQAWVHEQERLFNGY